jgi:hypothetical protein
MKKSSHLKTDGGEKKVGNEGKKWELRFSEEPVFIPLK